MLPRANEYDPSKTVRSGTLGAPASHRALRLAGENGPRRPGIDLASVLIMNTPVSIPDHTPGRIP